MLFEQVLYLLLVAYDLAENFDVPLNLYLSNTVFGTSTCLLFEQMNSTTNRTSVLHSEKFHCFSDGVLLLSGTPFSHYIHEMYELCALQYFTRKLIQWHHELSY